MIEFLTSDYSVHLAILIGIYLILAQSFNLCFGVGQLFNLAHIAVFGIGAYTTAIFSTELEVGFFSCFLASGLLSMLMAIFLGAIAVRLKKDYFAIGTLAFSAIVAALFMNWKGLTRGVLGIPGIPRPEIVSVPLYDNHHFLLLVCVCVLISQAILFILFYNRYGRLLRSQAEFEQAAQCFSQNTGLIRNMAFGITSFFAGIAGSLFSYFMNYIDPTSFALHEMIFVLTIVVVGGPGRFVGVILATFFLILLPEAFRFTGDVEPFLEWLVGVDRGELSTVFVLGWIGSFFTAVSQPSVLGPARQLLYALVLFSFVYFRRASLFSNFREV